MLIDSPDIEEAIDRHPLIVTADTSLLEAIALMSQTRTDSCLVTPLSATTNEISRSTTRSGYILVVENERIEGIVTERDIVKLTAAGNNLTSLSVGDVMTHPVITLNEKNFKDIFAALFLFRRYHIRHLPIVNESGKLLGVVSPDSIRQILTPANLLKMRRVAEVMAKNVVHSPPTVSVLEIARQMADRKTSCVVIAEEEDDDRIMPIGIITERDIVQFSYLRLNLEKLAVGEVMSSPLFLLTPEDSLWYAHQQMKRRHIRRLVVTWNWGKGLGIVTQTSILKVFDPIEMYEIVQTLQETLEKITVLGEEPGEDFPV